MQNAWTATTRYDLKVLTQFHDYACSDITGSSRFVTNTTVMNPPLYVDFDCSATDFTLSECARPSGLRTNVVDCGPGVVGVQCLGECRSL